MKEPFDKKITEKIRDTFEAHNEPFDPKEWGKFSDAYFGKSRKPFGAWWLFAGGIAASLLLVAVLWNPFKFSESAEESAAPIAYNQYEENAMSVPPTEKDSGPQASSDREGEIANSAEESAQNSNALVGKNSTTSHLKKESKLKLVPKENDSKSKVANLEVNQSKEEKTEVAQSLAKSQPLNTPSQANETSAAVQIEDAQQQINNWLAEAENHDETNDGDEKEKQPLKLGVLMAPQNISNSTQNINFGAGFMSEIPFSKRLRLDVGIAYAQQNLIPDQNGGSRYFTSDVASVESAKANMFAGNYINSTAELSFGQIEIPLNMKYSVIQKKSSDFYVVSGLSNMFYVNQQKTTTYNTVAFISNTPNAAAQTLNSSSISESPASSEGQVDVGQLINLGMGFEQNLKNGTSISFEPFYKFTVGDQTFVDQRFAIGGINLRMNFQLKK
jgi:hypothetical protein